MVDDASGVGDGRKPGGAAAATVDIAKRKTVIAALDTAFNCFDNGEDELAHKWLDIIRFMERL